MQFFTVLGHEVISINVALTVDCVEPDVETHCSQKEIGKSGEGSDLALTKVWRQWHVHGSYR